MTNLLSRLTQRSCPAGRRRRGLPLLLLLAALAWPTLSRAQCPFVPTKIYGNYGSGTVTFQTASQQIDFFLPTYQNPFIPYWSFDAIAGVTYTISNCNGYNDDNHLYLMGPAPMGVVAFNDDNGPVCSGQRPSLQWTCQVSANYSFTLAYNGAGNCDDYLTRGVHHYIDYRATYPAPTLSSLSPATAPVGAVLTLNGTGLMSASAIRFSGTSNNVVTNSFTVNATGTQITGVVVPPGATSGPVTVVTPGGTTAGVAFTLQSSVIVTGRTPARNATSAARSTNVALTFDGTLNPATAGNVRVFSALRGGQLVRNGNATVSGNTLTVDPAQNLQAGEKITVSVPSTVTGTGGQAACRHVYQFTAGVSPISLGTFAGGASITTPGAASYGSPMSATATADFDADGDQDLVLGNDANLEILLNNGAGVLSSGTTLSLSGGITAVTTGDVDGDGDVDIVANRYNYPATLGVFLNNGSGSFAAPALYSGSGGLRSLELADMDGDGDLDLVQLAYAIVTVRLNNGAGVFGAGTDVPGAEYYLQLGDMDDDGDLDMVVADGNFFRLLLNDGNGGFTAGSYVQLVPNGFGVNAMRIADVTGDGRLDMLVVTRDDNATGSSPTNGSVDVYPGNGNGSFGTKIALPNNGRYKNLEVGDLDGDGDFDLVLTGSRGLDTRLNTGAGLFGAPAAFTLPNTGSFDYRVMLLRDLDGNGTLDLLVPGSVTNFSSPSQPTTVTIQTRFNQLVPPTITAVAPAAAQVGAVVTISGTNLGDVTSVRFNGTAATTFTVNSATRLTATVPVGATTGLLTVATPYSSSAGVPFRVNYAPTGLALSATTVRENVAPNTAVGTLTTTDLNTDDLFTYALVSGAGDTDNALVNLSGDQLRLTASPDFETKNSYAVRVRTTDAAGLSFERALTIGILDVTAPVLTGSYVGTPGQTLTLTGTNLGGATAVTFGTVAGTSLAGVSATSLTVTVPSGAGSTLTVTTPEGTSTPIAFTLVPRVTAVTPGAGPIGGAITLTGEGFNATPTQNAVFFGATLATVTDASPTSLTVKPPVGATFQPLTVTNLTTALTGAAPQPFSPTLNGSTSNLTFATNINTYNPYPNAVAVGDLDGDGRPDAVTADENPYLTLLRNTTTTAGSTSISWTRTASYPVAGNARALALVDVDGDGKLDVITGNNTGPGASVLRNVSSSGSISLSMTGSYTTGANPFGVAAADLNADGKPDVVITNSGGSTLSLLRNTSTGPGSMVFALEQSQSVGNGPRTVVAADLDLDGRPDLVVSNHHSNTLTLLRNTTAPGAATFSFTTTTLNTGTQPWGVAVGDFNRDGRPDVAVSNFNNNNSGSTVQVFAAGGVAGTFLTPVTVAASNGPRTLRTTDVDGDGDLDLVVSSVGNSRFTIVPNTGAAGGGISFASYVGSGGQTEYSTAIALGSEPLDLAVADMNADGYPDVLTAVTTYSGPNTGNLAVWRQPTPTLTITSVSPNRGTIGSTVTLTGTGFIGASAVRFGSTSATFTVNSSTSITATVPASLTAGNYAVTVFGISGLSNGQTYTVVSNQAPTALALSPGSVAENAGANAVVGTLSTTDPNAGDTFTYALVSGLGSTDNAAFTIAVDQLRLTASADFETKSSYAIRVRTTDAGGLTFERAFTVTVTNVNEAPFYPGGGVAVTENTPIGTVIPTGRTGSDPDGDALTYAITGGSASGLFSINRTTGDLTVIGMIDYETNPVQTLDIQVSDGTLTRSGSLRIDLINVNEAPSLANATRNLAENAATGTAVGTPVTGTDPDAGTTLSYAITAGNAGNVFAINSGTGQLTVVGALNFETTASYTLTVRVTDNGSPALSTSATVTVTITNVNEAPSLADATRSVAENAASGTTIGAPITGTDPDAGTTLTYYIIATSAPGLFTLDATTGQLTVGGRLDFETTPSYVLTVRVTDTGSPALSSTATVTVSVTDVNEAPFFNSSFNTFFVPENEALGTAVSMLAATDPDAGTTLTYSITAGNPSGAFAIDATTGQLTVAGPLDFETQSSYSLTVRVSDGSLSDNVTATVLVYSVNEDPTALALSNATIAENTGANVVVGSLSTTDPDDGDTFTYALVSGAGSTDNTLVNIADTLLRITASPDFETKPSYAVRVRTTDQDGLFFERAFTLTITDVAEGPVTLTVAAPQNVPAGTYDNITVTGSGVATLTGAVVVNGTFVVQNGGALHTRCQPITGAGSFTLEAGATLSICDAAGISASGATGAVQVTGSRSFASDASYVYNGNQAQTTGSGLTGARELVIDNAAGVTLSQPAAVTNVLRLTSGTLATAGQLTLLSTATRTAYAVHAGGQTSGAVTVQRYVGGPTALGYRHLSSPVQAAPVSDLTTTGFTPKVNPAYNALPTPTLPAAQFPNVFGYDETRGGTTPAFQGFGTGYYSPAGLATPLSPGRGWDVLMGGGKTPDFVGALTTGNVPLALTVTGPNTSPNAQKAGWHLLGNPYPQPIDWDLATVPAGMSASISVFRTQGGNNGQYLTRANGVGNLTDGIVPLGQGFFVRALSASTFTFTNALRVEANPGPVARPRVDTRPTVGLTLNQTGAVEQDQAFVYFQDGASAGLDGHYDGQRPGHNPGTVPTLSALTSTGEEVAIDGLPETLLATGTTVALALDLPTAGAYTLAAAELANFGPTAVTLLDRLTGTRYDLATTPAVAFTAPAGVVAGRFALVFGQRALGTAATAAGLAPLRVFPNPASGSGSVRLDGGAARAALTVLDVAGRRVATLTTDATGTAELAVTGWAAGVYVVRAEDGRTTRLVVE